MSTEMMNEHAAHDFEIKQPSSIRKSTMNWWFQRIITLDDIPNQKHHRPIFIISMSVLHVFIFFLTYIDTDWRHQDFVLTLFDLCRSFLPCMRPTSQYIRSYIVNCSQLMKNGTCHYDDVLEYMCFSFTYPHQLWRLFTVNILHRFWLHLLSNLLIQVIQGIPLERKYGPLRVAIIYWLSGIGAVLTFIIKNSEACKYDI